MIDTAHEDLLDALLDSWDRNNRILVNLLHAVPKAALGLSATADSMCIIELFMHIHRCRLFFVEKNAPEVRFDAPPAPGQERNVGRIAELLDASALAVRQAMEGRIRSTQPMAERYDHPLLMLQHNLWHEGDHHGQVKLLLKQHGMALDHAIIGEETWHDWMGRPASAQDGGGATPTDPTQGARSGA